MPTKERVQKIIAARGVCSRRAAEAMIAAGRVTVNGRPAYLGQTCSRDDIIVVAGRRIPSAPEEFVTLILNKPRGYITTASDERGRKTVLELLRNVPERIYPVGRLDMASEGLLILTNDGGLAYRLTHPSYQIEKEYHVTVTGRPRQEILDKLSAGVSLEDGTTAPAVVYMHRLDEDRTVLSISIAEGKNHQIRRMCEAEGLEVRRLKRVRVGKIELDGLPVAQYRSPTPKEQKWLDVIKDSEKGADKSGK